MSRVAHIVQHLQPGGIECMVLDFLANGALGGNERPDIVISLDGTRDGLVDAWPRLVPYAERLWGLDKPPGFQPFLILRLGHLLRRLKVTAVHTHHIGPLLYGGLAARLSGVRRLIHTEHDAWHLADPKRRRLEGALLTLTRPTLVADAGLVADALKTAFPGCAPILIHNGIDPTRFLPGNPLTARAAFHLPQEPLIIGCAARLETVKGVDHLLRGFAALAPTLRDKSGQNRSVHLALAGGGSEATALRALAAELNIADRVTFLGRIDAMPLFYQALDLFCLASRAEGLPLSLLEAQACNIPVVATRVGGMADAVCPTTGTLVAPNDPAALAAALAATLIHRPLQPEDALTPDGASIGSPRHFILQERNLNVMMRAYHQFYTA